MTDSGKPPGPAGAATTVTYRLDPRHSRFTVQGFATGVLSFFAHSPTFAVRAFAGELLFDPAAVADVRLRMTMRADSLELLDQVRPADRADIEGRMRREVLETARYPEVLFEAVGTPVGTGAPHQYRLRLDGRLTVRGVIRPHPGEAVLSVYTDGARLAGESALRLSDYHIRPVTALGGAIRLEDRLRVTFDLVGWKGGSAPEGV